MKYSYWIKTNTKFGNTCNRCKHRRQGFIASEDFCIIAPIINISPVKGIEKKYRRCRDRNKNFDCIFFEKKEIKL